MATLDINSLLKPELQHELLSRGKLVEGCNVEDLRKRLRKVIHKESSGGRTYTRYIPDPLAELSACLSLLTELSATDLSNTRRVSALYHHILSRLSVLNAMKDISPLSQSQVLEALNNLDSYRQRTKDDIPVFLQQVLLGRSPTLRVVRAEPTVLTDKSIDLDSDPVLMDRPFRAGAMSLLGEPSSKSTPLGPFSSVSLGARPKTTFRSAFTVEQSDSDGESEAGDRERRTPFAPGPADVRQRFEYEMERSRRLLQNLTTRERDSQPQRNHDLELQREKERDRAREMDQIRRELEIERARERERERERERLLEQQEMELEAARQRVRELERTRQIHDDRVRDFSRYEEDPRIEALQRQLTALQSQLSLDRSSLSTSSKGAQMYKWDIKFGGEKSESVFSFLEKVEDRATSRQVSESALLKGAGDLFSGSALIWYRSGVERGIFTSWPRLVDSLKRTFLPQDWEDLLHEEIRNRKQGAEESIDIYVACMTKMFSRLPYPPSPMTQLKQIWKNLHLYYLERIPLPSVESIEDLLEKGRIVEYSRQIAERLKNPHRHWDKNLSELQAALNSAVHDVTGFSPHRLVYGTELCLDGRLRELRNPSDPTVPECAGADERIKNLAAIKDLYITVLDRLRKAYEKNAKFYNLRRREVHYAEGQIVYRRNFEKSDAAAYFSKKLAPKFVGPYTIKRRCGTRGYVLEDSEGKEDGPWHVHDLKLSPDAEPEV
ncbi:Activity-regulated cytoskeleton associated protein 1 [Frankliniella fusca]|uniref:Activity-regulated cytoskeleton associated protein 1 n=1 Tax=Frankliniella fusca TaxID=407009 RepID=A0AAE1LK53_9NEOP|nr:Activity-regulated cytoskeleton associated protein 1 [Frankliniella fusca]